MQNQLGFVPVIPVIVKALPAVLSIFGGKKKKKAEARMTEYLANEQKIASGQAVMATDVMTEADKGFLRKVWPQIRVAASFDHPNWASIGYPAGPALTPAAKAAITHAWPSVHSAANFDDVNWQYHAVPIDTVASLLPVPELGAQAPPLPVPGQPSSYYPGYSQPYAAGGYSQASILPAGIKLEYVAIAAAIGVAALLFSKGRR